MKTTNEVEKKLLQPSSLNKQYIVITRKQHLGICKLLEVKKEKNLNIFLFENDEYESIMIDSNDFKNKGLNLKIRYFN